jgi:hypothetical protein
MKRFAGVQPCCEPGQAARLKCSADTERCHGAFQAPTDLCLARKQSLASHTGPAILVYKKVVSKIFKT